MSQPKLFSPTQTAHLVFAKAQVHLVSLVLGPSQELVCRINDATRRESLARWWPRYFGTPVKLDHEMEVIQIPTTGTRHGQYDGVGRLVVIERGMPGQAFAQAFARTGLP